MNWASLPFISWNEMLWSQTMPPVINPVSSCGKNPFGISVNNSTLSAIVTNSAQHHERPWRSDHASVRS
jgi:hypothetical protein